MCSTESNEPGHGEFWLAKAGETAAGRIRPLIQMDICSMDRAAGAARYQNGLTEMECERSAVHRALSYFAMPMLMTAVCFSTIESASHL
jgi:hypothetical protein